MLTSEETKELYKKSFKALEKDWYVYGFDKEDTGGTIIGIYKKYPNIILFLDLFTLIYNDSYQLVRNVKFYLDKDHYVKFVLDDKLIKDIIEYKKFDKFYQIIEQMTADYCRNNNIPKPDKNNLLIYNKGDYFLFHPKDNPLKKNYEADSTIESIITIMSCD